jgi:acetylornithine/succinyldiaminopimelate/putrescine aminotransferase
MGGYLGSALEAMAKDASLPAGVEARGKGLLRGLRIAAGYDAMGVLARMREGGVLASTAGADVIRLAPALNVTREECDRALAALRDAVANAPSAAKK